MTVLAVLILTGTEFQVEVEAKALDPHFVRKRGTVHIFVLEIKAILNFAVGLNN